MAALHRLLVLTLTLHVDEDLGQEDLARCVPVVCDMMCVPAAT